MPDIQLQSSDGMKFKVDVETAKVSAVIKDMIEIINVEDDDDERVVPLPNVNAAILQKIIQWAQHDKENVQPTKEIGTRKDEADKCSQSNTKAVTWKSEFFKVDQGTLLELILAANYLDIKELLDVSCETVALMMKGRSPEEIRATFKLPNDLVEEKVSKLYY